MKESLEIVLGILSIAGFLGSLLIFYKSSVEKRYAAERDFAHIKNSLQQFNQGLQQLFDENDDLRGELKEVKSYAQSFSQRLDSLLSRIEMQSGFFANRNKNPD